MINVVSFLQKISSLVCEGKLHDKKRKVVCKPLEGDESGCNDKDRGGGDGHGGKEMARSGTKDREMERVGGRERMGTEGKGVMWCGVVGPRSNSKGLKCEYGMKEKK